MHDDGVSWVGFYLKDPSAEQLVLGPRRDKPACSPIGLHGVCGRCYGEARPIVVRDVTALAGGYIACDPRDRAEIVVPLIDASGACYAVLDLDSFDVGAFESDDAVQLLQVLRRAGLQSGGNTLII